MAALYGKNADEAKAKRFTMNIIEEDDLQALGKQMKAQRLGVMVMFYASYCEFCERLEEDLLVPMLRSGEYDGKVLIRKIQIDSNDELINFNGQTITTGQISTLYGADMTPTLVFLDANGKEQSERILGYTTPDFFSAYVDQGINELHKTVKTSE